MINVKIMPSYWNTYLSQMFGRSYDTNFWMLQTKADMEHAHAIAKRMGHGSIFSMAVYMSLLGIFFVWASAHRPITNTTMLGVAFFLFTSILMLGFFLVHHFDSHPFRLLSTSSNDCQHVLNICDASPEANAYLHAVVANRPLYVVDKHVMAHHWGKAWQAKKDENAQRLCQLVHSNEHDELKSSIGATV